MDESAVDDTFVGNYAKVAEPIAPGKPGKVEYSGCLWEAESEETLEKDERVKITSKNNLTLIVGKG